MSLPDFSLLSESKLESPCSPPRHDDDEPSLAAARDAVQALNESAMESLRALSRATTAPECIVRVFGAVRVPAAPPPSRSSRVVVVAVCIWRL